MASEQTNTGSSNETNNSLSTGTSSIPTSGTSTTTTSNASAPCRELDVNDINAIPGRFTLPKQFIILDGKNYDNWYFHMKTVFQAEKAWGIVSGTIPMPTTEPRLSAWKAKDEAARLTINFGISVSCFSSVSQATSAHEAWQSLWNAYKQKGLLAAFNGRIQMMKFRFDASKDLNPQIDELRKLRMETTEGGIACEDWEFCLFLLAALPESYYIVRQTLLATYTDLKDVNLTSLISRVRQFEMELNERNSPSNVDEAAFASRSGPPRPRNKGQPNKNKDKPPSSQDKTGTCNWCRREGHWEADCNKKREMHAQAQQGADKSNQRRNKNKNKNGNGKDTDASAWVAKIAEDDQGEQAKSTNGSDADGNWWEFDSGASRVFHGDLSAFANYKPFDTPIPIGLATSGSSASALGSGDITIRFSPTNSPSVKFTITGVYYAPGMMSLISIRHLDDLGRRAEFSGQRLKIWKDDKLELSIPRIGNSYKCRGLVVPPENPETVHAAKTSQTLWHRRWGHLGHSSLLEMSRKGLVTKFEFDTTNSGSDACDACLRGKHTRSPFPKGGRTRATKLLELVHSDVCGPFPVTREGYKYYASFVDDYSEFAVVYRLKEKSGVADAFKDYKLRAELHTEHKLKAVQTDNGGEYEGEFERHCTLHGIHHRRTTPYTPEQNGVAERLNRTLCDLMVSCLIGANAGDSYWGDAILYALYTRNRSPSRAIPGYVPYTLWNKGTLPSVDHLRPFGCTAFAQVPKKTRTKLEPKSTKAMFIGYDAHRKAWRLYDPEKRKEFPSRDVTFLEDTPYLSEKGKLTIHSDVSDDDSFISGSEDESDAPNPVSSPSNPVSSTPTPSTQPPPTSASIPDPTPQTPQTPVPESPAPTPPAQVPAATQTIAANRGRRQVKAPEKYTDKTWGSTLYARMAYEFGLAATDPRTYKEATSGPDAKQWEESIASEYQSLVSKGTFEVVDLPPGRKAIPSTYVFKEKTGPDGQTIKFKTRIVARGDFQKEGIDFGQVYAPVPRLDTVRAVFAYAASRGWDIDQLDFKSAFLNGDLEEEVYMKPPEGYSAGPGKVWLLKKSLYGLRQSPKCWHKKLTGRFKELQLVRSTADFSLYIGNDGTNTTIVLTHVDDTAISGNSRAKMDEVKAFIKLHFEVDDMGKLHFYLAIEWTRDWQNRTITGHQTKFARTILKRFRMEECTPAETPIAEGTVLTTADCPVPGSKEEEYMKNVPYLEAIGSLMYLMLGTRPDLAFAIGKLSRFGNNPGTTHWNLLKRVISYVKGTLNYSITLGGDSRGIPKLIAYSDSSFQDCPDTSRSTSGYVFFLGVGPVSWSSKRQTVVTNSTMEAEYIGLSNAARHAIWLRELLQDIGCKQTNPTTIYGDNNASLILAQDSNDHDKAKHIKRVYHYVRERISQEGDIAVEYCPGKVNVADVFTKALGRLNHSKFILRLVSPPPGLSPNPSGSVV